MIKIKPEMWRDLPALAKYMELELKLSDGAVYIDKSDSVPTLLRALPINLAVAEFFVDYAGKIVYAYRHTEERKLYAKQWLQDATKWTPEICEQLTVSRLKKFVSALRLPHLVGIAPLAVAREFIKLREESASIYRKSGDYRTYETHGWATEYELDTLVSFMRRRDITQEERDACALQWTEVRWELNSPPMVTSALHNLGVSPETIKKFLEVKIEGSTSAAERGRWVSELKRMEKEETHAKG